MALIPQEIISQVIERCDIADIVAAYIPLKRAGRNFKANCPFHEEKTPSFIVNPDKQIFHCFGCGVGGNVVSFVMKQERLLFPEAVRMLAQKVNITVPENAAFKAEAGNGRQDIFRVTQETVAYFHTILLSDKNSTSQAARTYLQKRGIRLETVEKFQLGLAVDAWDGLLKHLRAKKFSLNLIEKAGLIIARQKQDGFYDRFRNRLMFPILDTMGHCRAFGARQLEAGKQNAETMGAKYINSPETLVYTKGHHLYGFHLAKQSIIQKDCVIIVEGYTDCLIPFQEGVTNIVASLGTALTVEQIRLLRRYTKNVIMLFDMDLAGESAMLRSLDILMEEGMNVTVATLEDNEDPDSFIRKFGVESFEDRVKTAKQGFDYKYDILTKRHDVKTAEGKAKVSSEMLDTISRVTNEIIQADYIRHLAQKLRIDEVALRKEWKKAETQGVKKYFQKEQKQKIYIKNQRRSVERKILKLLLEEQDFISVTKEEVGLNDFHDVKIRQGIAKIYELFEQGKTVNSLHLINSFEDESMQHMITELMTEDEGIESDKKKMHRDYIGRIKNDRLKLRSQAIRQEICEAEGSGDQSKLNDLMIELHQLVKERK